MAEAAALSCRQGLDVVQQELRAASQLDLAACPPALPGASLQEHGDGGSGSGAYGRQLR